MSKNNTKKLLLIIIKIAFSCCVFLYTATSYAEQKPRIVSLTPSLTDMVIELGASDQIVGILDMGPRPTIINHVASIGDYGRISLEKLISLNPDIILLWPSSITKTEQKRLISLGYKVIESDPHTFDELAKQLIVIGRLIGQKEQGEKLSQQMRDELTHLRKQYHRDKPLRVFYQIWSQPLFTIGKNQIINDALKTCGAENIFEDMALPVPQVSLESVLARNPEVIIATHQSSLGIWESWPNLTAVKNKQLLSFDNQRIARPSFAMLLATKQLCQVLHNIP